MELSNTWFSELRLYLGVNFFDFLIEIAMKIFKMGRTMKGIMLSQESVVVDVGRV